MDVIMRPAAPDDAPTCGQICYAAFGSLADHHGFPRDFPSVKMASDVLRMLIEHAGFYGVVAERDGTILGSNFMDERSAVLGIGPISVDPAAQDKGIGRSLMLNVLDRATARHAAGVRLVQAAYHNRSLCLYTKLGFQTKEPLSVLQGPPIGLDFPGYTVRPADPADIDACNALCTQIHGFDRGDEVRDAVQQQGATVVEHLGRITGYGTLVGFFGHSVAETDHDLIALIAAAQAFPGPGFLLPTRNHRVFSWCLNHGLKLSWQGTLMTMGLYNEPAGAWLPSILY